MTKNNNNNDISPEEEPNIKKTKGNKILYSLLTSILILLLLVIGWLVYDKNKTINNLNTNNKSQLSQELIDENLFENTNNEMGHIVEFEQMVINLSSLKEIVQI